MECWIIWIPCKGKCHYFHTVTSLCVCSLFFPVARLIMCVSSGAPIWATLSKGTITNMSHNKWWLDKTGGNWSKLVKTWMRLMVMWKDNIRMKQFLVVMQWCRAWKEKNKRNHQTKNTTEFECKIQVGQCNIKLIPYVILRPCLYKTT